MNGTINQRDVILCDSTGRPTGAAEIWAAHSGRGQLHLAFSVYVFSPDGRSLLVQQRSAAKRLWPLVWANTCCSHPRAGESPVAAGQRRLQEELGLLCDLVEGTGFEYRAEDPNGHGVEHEFDVILVGTSAGDPRPDPAEVADWQWIELADLRQRLRTHPERYAPWLHLGLEKAVQCRG